MEQIIQTGSVTRGWIGIEVRDISAEQAQELGLPQSGTLITGIINGGPADKGGIQPGDLLVAIDQQAVRDAQQMLQSIAELAPGHAARLTIRRGANSLDKSVKIERRPPAEAIEE
jgi:S1-C subfamily serine protease